MRRWSCELQPKRASPDYPCHPSSVPCHIPRRTERVRASIASQFTRPSPLLRRVGVRIFTFEACSGFTRVTARWIAQPPKRPLSRGFNPVDRPTKLLVSYQINRQLSGWNPSSTGVTRLRGALRNLGWCLGRRMALVINEPIAQPTSLSYRLIPMAPEHEAADIVQSGIAGELRFFYGPLRVEKTASSAAGGSLRGWGARHIRQLRSLGVTDVVEIPEQASEPRVD